jgi:hypothetical protein
MLAAMRRAVARCWSWRRGQCAATGDLELTALCRRREYSPSYLQLRAINPYPYKPRGQGRWVYECR